MTLVVTAATELGINTYDKQLKNDWSVSLFMWSPKVQSGNIGNSVDRQ